MPLDFGGYVGLNRFPQEDVASFVQVNTFSVVLDSDLKDSHEIVNFLHVNF